jgi:hypothetical protein
MWLLLVLVAAGVGLMHTLGHPSVEHCPGHGTVLSAPVMVGAGAADDGGAGHFNPTDVCLATLLGGMLVLLAALLAAIRHEVAGGGGVRRVRWRAGRGPPVRPFGLLIADLSVLRT